MDKKHLKTLIITSAITLLPILVGLLLWQKLPDEIATHFSENGTPNGFSSKPFTVFAIPFFLFAMQIFCFFVSLADPRKEKYDTKLFSLVLWICPMVSILCFLLIYSYALGYNLNVGLITSIFLGVIIMIIGNLLPKCKRNYTIGIKLPWTMNSDENWNKTHRLAGFLWVVGGITIIATAVFAKLAILLGTIFVITIVPSIYSYVYYIKHER